MVVILWDNITMCKRVCNRCRVRPILNSSKELRGFRVNDKRAGNNSSITQIISNKNLYYNGRRLRSNEYVYYHTTGNYEIFEKNLGNNISTFEYNGSRLSNATKCVRGRIALSNNRLYSTLMRNGKVIKKNVIIQIRDV